MKHYFLGKSKWILGCMLSVSLLAVSCRKEDDSTKDDVITTDDAADITTNAVASASYGIQSSVSSASQTATEKNVYTTTPSISCGQTYPNSFTASQTTNTYSYNYNINGTYQMTCTSLGLPSTFIYTLNMQGNYDTPRMSSNDTSQGNLVFTGLAPSSTNAIVNGNFTRNGNQVSKVQNQRTFTSTTQINLTDLTINKSTAKILSGTGTATISVTSSGVTKNFTGNITFNGNGVATLLINGVSYTINL